MKNFALVNHSFKLKLAVASLLLTVITFNFSYAGGDDKMNEQKNVIVSMAGELFKIPQEYLSPNKELPEEIEKDNMIEISFFFPDFSGFEKGDNLSTVGTYNKKQVTAFWTRVSGGGRLDANKSIGNAIKYGLSIRDTSLDIDGLMAYKNANNTGVTYKAQNTQGEDVLIHCSEGPVNSVCKLEYLDSINNRGIFASFDKEHLPNWLQINNKIISLISDWKV
jgi:hypothetical protein